jgi:hypothetical protein
MSACGLVGWMSKLTLFFIPKIYIVGLVIVALLDGREQRTLVFEDCLGVHLVQAEICLAL